MMGIRGKKLRSLSFGVTLVESLIAIVVLSGLVLLATTAITSALVTKNQLDVEKGMSNFSLKLVETLNSNVAWMQILENDALNPSLSCLRASTSNRDCRASAGTSNSGAQSLVILDGNGDIIFNPNTQGLSPSGEPCNDRGTTACPLGVEVSWMPICDPSEICLNPQIRFVGRIRPIVTGDSQLNRINFAKYDFDFVQSRSPLTLADTCRSLDGTFDLSTGTCQLPLNSGGDCPDPLVVVRIDENMRRVCGPLWQGACSPNEFLAGVNAADGSPVCSPKPACTASGSSSSGSTSSTSSSGSTSTSSSGSTSTSSSGVPNAGCGAGAVSWVRSGNTCSGSIVAAAHGQSSSVNNTAANRTGNASFTCSNGAWGFNSGTCNVTNANCTSRTLSWTVSGRTCSGTAATTTHLATRTVANTASTVTGSASWRCNNGVWALQPGATCASATNLSCPAMTLSRRGHEGNTCTFQVPSRIHGQTYSHGDRAFPNSALSNGGRFISLSPSDAWIFFTVNLRCNNGVWEYFGAFVCYGSSGG